jgi:hypothetical protein
MDANSITRDNLPQAVAATLDECRAALACATNAALIQDLTVALRALELIQAELDGTRPPRTVRSAMFIRYVLDEEPQIVMDRELRDRIQRIEHLYKRY